MNYEDLIRVLQENKDTPFVRRIMDRYIYPVLDNKDGSLLDPTGSISTHSMASGEGDGRHFAYPTVVSDNNSGLERLTRSMLKRPGQPAWDNAMKTGNNIEFSSGDDADWFARNYKQAWK